jgi:hypothetical protein
VPQLYQHSYGTRATRASRAGERRICTVEQERVRQQWRTIQVHNKLADEPPAALTGTPQHHHFAEHGAGISLQRDSDPAVQMRPVTDDRRFRLPVQHRTIGHRCRNSPPRGGSG